MVLLQGETSSTTSWMASHVHAGGVFNGRARVSLDPSAECRLHEAVGSPRFVPVARVSSVVVVIEAEPGR